MIPGGERYLAIQELARFGLNLNMQKLFKYAKIKGNLLIFVFSHPAGLQEFRLGEEIVKTRMRMYYKEHLSAMKEHGIVFERIHGAVFFVKDEVKQPQSEKHFVERATGNFHIGCKGNLAKLFEEVKTLIRENNNGNKTD
jgi:hypothetical protein